MPIRLIGRFRNNEIMGNKMIKGRPTETQQHITLISTIKLKGKFDSKYCSSTPSEASAEKYFSKADKNVIREQIQIIAGENSFNKFEFSPKLKGKTISKLI